MGILVTRSSMPSYEEYCEEIKELWDSHWLTNMGVKHKKLQDEKQQQVLNLHKKYNTWERQRMAKKTEETENLDPKALKMKALMEAWSEATEEAAGVSLGKS